MIRAGRAAALGAAGLATGALAVAAPPRVPLPAARLTVTGPADDTLLSATPSFAVRSDSVLPNERPLLLTLELSTRSDFAQLVYFDQAAGDSARFVPRRPLPHLTPIFWRARAATALGGQIVTPATGPRVTAPWLRLLAPNPLGGVTLLTRRPTFIWQAAPIANPPGPWRYDLAVENVATREVLRYANLAETQFGLPRSLEFNASYRWAVTARAGSGDTTTVRSQGSFVIADLSIPMITLLYQNFPNPFPSSSSTATCVWFDLHRDANVRLTIHDIRGNTVRTLIPAPGVPDRLIAGRYGRGLDGQSGCAPGFSWDGTDNSGRLVETGVYIVRLNASGLEAYKRAVFRGR
ncbi:MAG: hypothetical protein ACT4R6_06800 [Gemmatimonadaceae bacterium]